MDPAFLANHLREEIDRAVNGKNRAKREAERWASLTDEEKAWEKKVENCTFIGMLLLLAGIFLLIAQGGKNSLSGIHSGYCFLLISVGLFVLFLPMNNWGCFSIALIIFLLSLYSLYYF